MFLVVDMIGFFEYTVAPHAGAGIETRDGR